MLANILEQGVGYTVSLLWSKLKKCKSLAHAFLETVGELKRKKLR